jgi:hypothetical protein
MSRDDVSTVTSEAGDEEVAHGEHVIVCSVFFLRICIVHVSLRGRRVCYKTTITKGNEAVGPVHHGKPTIQTNTANLSTISFLLIPSVRLLP